MLCLQQKGRLRQWLYQISKKLAAVLVISTLMTATPDALQSVPWIWYFIQFQAQQIKALINSGSKVNTMTPTFANKLGLLTRSTNVGGQKLDGFPLATYGMVVAGFLLQDS